MSPLHTLRVFRSTWRVLHEREERWNIWRQSRQIFHLFLPLLKKHSSFRAERSAVEESPCYNTFHIHNNSNAKFELKKIKIFCILIFFFHHSFRVLHKALSRSYVTPPATLIGVATWGWQSLVYTVNVNRWITRWTLTAGLHGES